MLLLPVSLLAVLTAVLHTLAATAQQQRIKHLLAACAWPAWGWFLF